jgi:hypothetical protein
METSEYFLEIVEFGSQYGVLIGILTLGIGLSLWMLDRFDKNRMN